MRKFLLALIAVLLVSSCVYSDEVNYKVGMLTKLNISAEDFTRVLKSEGQSGQFQKFILGGSVKNISEIIYYDSLISLLMALNSGEVNEINLPEDVAEYVLNINDNYTISSIVRASGKYSLAFGFRSGDNLRNIFNEALSSMKSDGTIAILQAKYISDAGLKTLEPVKFEHFDNARTIKAAVTGDMPPIDFINESGIPAGFNTAVLAEIGKRLKINIELVNIDAGARAAALASGRVDTVFWFQVFKDAEQQGDVPESIALSEPYYSWDEMFYLKLKEK